MQFRVHSVSRLLIMVILLSLFQIKVYLSVGKDFSMVKTNKVFLKYEKSQHFTSDFPIVTALNHPFFT